MLRHMEVTYQKKDPDAGVTIGNLKRHKREHHQIKEKFTFVTKSSLFINLTQNKTTLNLSSISQHSFELQHVCVGTQMNVD
jgi:hypothetical protein